MKITKEIFENFIACPYKAYRTLRNEFGNKTEYEITSHHSNELYAMTAVKKYFSKESNIEITSQNIPLENGYRFLHRKNISYNELSSCCDIERVSGNSRLGTFFYIPLLFSQKEKLSKNDKLLITFDGLILGELQDRMPTYGKIIHGNNFRVTKIKIDDQVNKIKSIIYSLKKLCVAENSPQIILNRHCQVCEFKDSCRIMVVEKDDLSLLSGISAKEIESQHKKGIFTVTQYSYTFRPRRKFRKSYPFNLKALAIREKRIHVYGAPEIPTADIQIYLDVEGDSDRNFYYLIGVIIVQNGIEKRYSFWADNQNQEEQIFSQFLNILKDYSEFKLYHYGSFEIKFLQKIRKSFNHRDEQLFNKIAENSVNILAIIYSNIFFPTYSNGLKDIGAYLGFKWSNENASGMQSLVWRKQFETVNDREAKSRLIEYNLEDCLALRRLVEFIKKINLNLTEGKTNDRDVVYTDDLKNETMFKWGTVDFVLDDLAYINNCAYFNYQRDKVFIRINRKLKNAKKYGRFQKRHSCKINKKIMSPIHRECPYCKGKLYRNGQGCSKVVYDLKFSDSGIKRWITVYKATRVRCIPCGKLITFESLQEIPKYGHNLIVWVIYQNIVGHQPFYRIQYMLDDLFGLSISGIILQRFKSTAAEYYRETYEGIIQKIKQGNLIHIDETQVVFQKVSGYVWVLTNMEDVYFLYTPTREGNFLKELLSGFKGVLISDFYGAYCSAGWIQQKCLIHLIRDLNDDLRKNSFDEEYKKMVVDFSVLLRQIITTVDKYGLAKRRLSKHKKNVARYFRNVLGCHYHSELAQKYQKRFRKNEKTLFTFLDYDGVPWNNNNAEHAIKYFADYRRIMKKGGSFTEKGLNDYLILLSIYQTCRYRGINFMKFLISKEKAFGNSVKTPVT